MPFQPNFSFTAQIAVDLMRIEGARQAVVHLPITVSVLTALRETARLYSTHYSTVIEGNRLTQEQVSKVIGKQGHFPGREHASERSLGCSGIETTSPATMSNDSSSSPSARRATCCPGGARKVF
jgi:hypothetical protein